jgi:microcystin-dependent protein
MPAQTIIKLRRGTASEWTTANPVLAAGEMGIETDTQRSKFGDGTTAWASLSYTVGDSSGLGSIAWTSVTDKPTEFPPEPHAASHELGGADEIEIAPSQVTGTAIVEGDARLTDARTPTAHTHVVADITDFDPATKQNTITGAATTITSSNLTASRAVVSDGSGKVAVSAATAAEVSHLSGVTSAIQTQLNGKAPVESGSPAGAVIQFAGTSSPSGWLLCDGQAVSRTTFAGLFAAIGTTYGTGNGSSTFNVPNLKGRVVVGQDAAQTEFDAMGETGGAKTHALTIAELAAHAHGYSVAGSATAVNFGSQFGAFTQNFNTSTGGAGSGTAHNNLQPYLVMSYLIKT